MDEQKKTVLVAKGVGTYDLSREKANEALAIAVQALRFISVMTITVQNQEGEPVKILTEPASQAEARWALERIGRAIQAGQPPQGSTPQTAPPR
jgi:hypothetical protein